MQFEFHQSALALLLCQLDVIGLQDHHGGAIGTSTSYDKTTRHHRIADSLGKRLRLAGQKIRVPDYLRTKGFLYPTIASWSSFCLTQIS